MPLILLQRTSILDGLTVKFCFSSRLWPFVLNILINDEDSSEKRLETKLIFIDN